MGKKLIIVGGVAAGATAAARARRLDEDAEIMIFERGPYVSFANCGLPYFLSGDIPKRSQLLLQTPEGFYSRYRVNVETNTEVVAIDRAAKTVTVRGEEGERTVAYDSLILAQGGTPVKPPIPGIERPEVHTLWTVPDMDGLQKALKGLQPGAPVAVIGGGFVGLEVAEAFAKRGFQTTVIEKMPTVLPHLDPEFGRLAQEELAAHGVTVLTGLGVKAFEEKTLVLEDDRRIPSEATLLSIGVRSRLELAQAAGLELGPWGGLKVDAQLRTSDPAIWAAGDMVEIPHRVSGQVGRVPLAGPANRQGRLAAENALGGQARYSGALGSSVVKVMDLTLASTGLTEAGAQAAGFDAAAAVVYKDQHVSYMPNPQKIFLKLVFDQTSRKVLGVQTAGRDGAEKRVDAAAVAFAAGFTVDQLAELDLAYAPPYNSAHDGLNMAAFVAQNHLSGNDPVLTAAGAYEAVHGAAAVPGGPSAGVYLIDLRTRGERAKDGGLTGSIAIPVDELRDRLAELSPDKTVLVYDKDGSLGHVAARQLRQRGFARVFNLTGGAAALRLEPRWTWNGAEA